MTACQGLSLLEAEGRIAEVGMQRSMLSPLWASPTSAADRRRRSFAYHGTNSGHPDSIAPPLTSTLRQQRSARPHAPQDEELVVITVVNDAVLKAARRLALAALHCSGSRRLRPSRAPSRMSGGEGKTRGESRQRVGEDKRREPQAEQSSSGLLRSPWKEDGAVE